MICRPRPLPNVPIDPLLLLFPDSQAEAQDEDPLRGAARRQIWGKAAPKRETANWVGAGAVSELELGSTGDPRRPSSHWLAR